MFRKLSFYLFLAALLMVFGCKISGTVTEGEAGRGGVNINIGETGSLTIEEDGTYVSSDISPTNYTVTPVLEGYTFFPESQTVTIVDFITGNAGSVDFVASINCIDNDGDGYGNPADASCEQPELDCDDTDPEINPGATEDWGNGIDDDCDEIYYRFSDINNGTVRDNKTGLIWLKDANCFVDFEGFDNYGRSDWDTAISIAYSLEDGQCGLDDGSVAGTWRLPSIEEWEAFVVPGQSWPANTPWLCNAIGTAQWSEDDAFINVSPCNYWSGSECGTNNAEASPCTWPPGSVLPKPGTPVPVHGRFVQTIDCSIV